MQVTFRLANSFFSIDTQSGILRVAQLFDRDVICAYQDSCKQNLEVQLRTSTSFQIIKLVIDVTDVNDHSPLFTPAVMLLNISEQTVQGTEFLLPSADDPDGGVDGVQSYSIVQPNVHFELVVNQLADGSDDVRLRLKLYLVKAQATAYSLTVLAVDGGNPPRSGYLTVNITVTSSSVNELTFNKSTYDVTVKENLAIGTVLVFLTVNEGAGGGQQIGYTLDDYSKQQFGKVMQS